jgi:hypothetical protein
MGCVVRCNGWRGREREVEDGGIVCWQAGVSIRSTPSSVLGCLLHYKAFFFLLFMFKR